MNGWSSIEWFAPISPCSTPVVHNNKHLPTRPFILSNIHHHSAPICSHIRLCIALMHIDRLCQHPTLTHLEAQQTNSWQSDCPCKLCLGIHAAIISPIPDMPLDLFAILTETKMYLSLEKETKSNLQVLTGFMQTDSTLPPLQLAGHSQRPYRALDDAMFAFDSPVFHILAEKLADMDVPRFSRRCLHYLFFCSLTSTAIANGRKSRLIIRRRGLS